VGDEGQIVLLAVLLVDQCDAGATIPVASPAFVRPTQAERQVERGISQPLLQRFFQQCPATEPVEIEAEAFDPVFAGKSGLPMHDLGLPKVVIAKVSWNTRLPMAFELWQCVGDIVPFGEAGAPPRIVLRNGVELGQVKRDQARGKWCWERFGAISDMPDRRCHCTKQWTTRGCQGGSFPMRRPGDQMRVTIEQPIA